MPPDRVRAEAGPLGGLFRAKIHRDSFTDFGVLHRLNGIRVERFAMLLVRRSPSISLRAIFNTALSKRTDGRNFFLAFTSSDAVLNGALDNGQQMLRPASTQPCPIGKWRRVHLQSTRFFVTHRRPNQIFNGALCNGFFRLLASLHCGRGSPQSSASPPE